MEGMLKLGSLTGKTIIITGGGTGLGKSMGKYFLELGANLVITSRKLDVLQNTASEMMRETGGKVLALPCDVRKYEEVEKVIKQSEEEFGQINACL
jgi:NADP-dependent 3-hydroxy acid dehydrogenase YdfG